MYNVGGSIGNHLVPSIVLDIGSHSTKCGYAGEDLPCRVVPSVIGVKSKDKDKEKERERNKDTQELGNGQTAASVGIGQQHVHDIYAGDADLLVPRENMDIVSPFNSDGIITHWNSIESLLSHILSKELNVVPEDWGMMVTEPMHNTKSAREKLCEILFEQYKVPALYLAKAAMLSAFANGKTTALVLDMGASGTSCVPVVEGSVLKHRVMRSPLGGNTVSESVLALCNAKGAKLRPNYEFRKTQGDLRGSLSPVKKAKLVAGKALSVGSSGNGTSTSNNNNNNEDEDDLTERHYRVTDVSHMGFSASYEKWRKSIIIDDVKESGVIQISESANAEPQAAGLQLPGVSYYLPDGNRLDFGNERYQPAGVFFEKIPVISSVGPLDADMMDSSMMSSRQGLSNMVKATIERCEQNTHRDLYASVCLTGGSSNFPGLFERLNNELMYITNRVRVVAAAGAPERRFCAWTGGSILATFSEFQRMWFGKAEYDELGASLVHKKCS